MCAYIDGWPGAAVAISQAPKAFPLRRFGDTTHAVYVRKYRQRLAEFLPTAIGTVDPLAAGFYLMEESAPELDQGEIATFFRTYANIPATSYSYGSQKWTRPTVPGSGQYRVYGSEAAGNAGLFYQPNTSIDAFRVFTTRAVASDSGFTATPTGGTLTLTVNGQTTAAQAYNATAATMATAISGLTTIANAGALCAGSTDASGNTRFQFGGEYDSNESPRIFSTVALNTLATTNGYINVTSNLVYYDPTVGRTLTKIRRGWQSLVAVPGASASISVNTASLTTTTHLPTFTADGYVVDGRNILRVMFPNDGSGSTRSRISGGSMTVTVGGKTATVAFDGATFADTIKASLAAQGVNCTKVEIIAPSPFLGLGDTWEYTHQATGFYIYDPTVNTEPTSGSFNFTWGGSTIAIAYNASAATIDTAIRAMGTWTAFAALGGTLTVTRTTGLFSVDLAYTVGAITVTPSLTPSPASATITGGRVLSLVAGTVPRTITTTNAHGLTAGQEVYIKQGGYTFGLSNYTVLDSTRIQVQPGAIGWSSTAITELGGYVCEYMAGPRTYNTRTATKYWLPGVSSGISTPADIPAPADEITDSAFLDAHFSSAGGWARIESGDLEYYMGPIVCRKETEIRLK